MSRYNLRRGERNRNLAENKNKHFERLFNQNNRLRIFMKKKTLDDYKAANLNPKKKLFNKGDTVYNSVETAGDDPIVGDGIWLEYWEAASGKAIPENCPCCKEPLDRDSGNIHGTHVQENRALLATKYIIPTCAGCNGKHGQQLSIDYVDEILGVEAINK